MNSRESSPHDNLSTLSDREKIYLTNSVGKTYDLDDSRKMYSTKCKLGCTNSHMFYKW